MVPLNGPRILSITHFRLVFFPRAKRRDFSIQYKLRVGKSPQNKQRQARVVKYSGAESLCADHLLFELQIYQVIFNFF